MFIWLLETTILGWNFYQVNSIYLKYLCHDVCLMLCNVPYLLPEFDFAVCFLFLFHIMNQLVCISLWLALVHYKG